MTPGKKDEEKPGTLLSYRATLRSVWTDTKPPPPK